MPADVAVLGLGHLGLPAAQATTAAGMPTVGFTRDARAAAALTAGRAPAEGPLTAAEIRRMLTGGFTVSTDPAVLSRVRTALICEPAPARPDRLLDLTAIGEAARVLAPRLRPHTLVVLESPVCPGTTEELVRPLLEQGSGLRAGHDFRLACSAGSRAEPGGQAAGGPRVIGGLTPACTEAAAAFYGRFAEKLMRARGPKEAETARVLETNLRHVQLALVNEMAVLCHELGVDLWDVLRCTDPALTGTAAAGGPGAGPGGGGHAGALRPGPGTGTGGHTGPIDAGLLPGLRRGSGRPLRMVELAQEVNAGMPHYVTQRAAALLNEHGKSVRGARVLLLGVTSRPDAADRQGAPATEIASRLRQLGAQLSYHDPLVPHWRVAGRPVTHAGELCESLYEAAALADLTLLLQNHSTYDLQGLAAKAQLLFDTRGVTPAGAAHRL
ncbi:nucleotide sugar dehydrogenase [Streptomyces aidingensis]|uniref:Nucleotide sugar dehydrogenase n=1 Tax=Streptomyces aidingensis TaxID=910347 RepID=A0A1I1EAA0_9ACTN|nr:UDP binding domain-containing protein [Streptomyces aidingensis]SFB83997.1 nucleotide sugar dehydrogenase [Streptomyces aidingensis]